MTQPEAYISLDLVQDYKAHQSPQVPPFHLLILTPSHTPAPTKPLSSLETLLEHKRMLSAFSKSWVTWGLHGVTLQEQSKNAA